MQSGNGERMPWKVVYKFRFYHSLENLKFPYASTMKKDIIKNPKG